MNWDVFSRDSYTEADKTNTMHTEQILDDTLYDIALGMTRGVDATVVRNMQRVALTSREFFAISAAEVRQRLTLGSAKSIDEESRTNALKQAELEMQFMQRNGIRAVTLLDTEHYPGRLAQLPDAPLTLYVKGTGEISTGQMISVVGTRRYTAQGESFCRRLFSDFDSKGFRPTIVSGLADGIDTIAHTLALEYGLPTLAVLANGLHTCYPARNRQLMMDILDRNGAIITEYRNGMSPLKSHFLRRNRIIAGLSDVTLVVESAVRGGSMSTAASAAHYQRLVCAVPGRWCDENASGCNMLIRDRGAKLVTCADDLMDAAGWHCSKQVQRSKQVVDTETPDLFASAVSGESLMVFKFMTAAGGTFSVDELCRHLGVASGQMMQYMFELESAGMVTMSPGFRFEVISGSGK